MSSTSETDRSWLTGETDESEGDHRELILSAERLYRAVRFKRKRTEARFKQEKIERIVKETVNAMIDSITAGKIVCISRNLKAL